MMFTFDIKKTVASAGYLLALGGGNTTVLKLVKMLYYADRMALQSWHRTITGDNFYSLENGPIVSTTYDLIKGTGPKKLQSAWDQYVGARQHNTVPLVRMPDTTVLSEQEKQTLAAAFAKIAPMRTGQVIEWFHTFPEWKDPQGSATRIDPRSILRLTTPLTVEDIAAIDEEVEQSNFIEATFLAAPTA